jgi:predicted PurR-regulated permease PerM
MIDQPLDDQPLDDQPLIDRDDTARTGVRVLMGAGRGAWAFVGICVAFAILATGFAVIGEVMLPLVFAAVLAVCFRPLATLLQHHRHVSTAAASGVVVLGLLALAFVEPLVTGRSLRIHPLVVLLVTTLGGILGGLVGLMMVVPLAVITARGIKYLRTSVQVDTNALRAGIRRSI